MWARVCEAWEFFGGEGSTAGFFSDPLNFSLEGHGWRTRVLRIYVCVLFILVTAGKRLKEDDEANLRNSLIEDMTIGKANNSCIFMPRAVLAGFPARSNFCISDFLAPYSCRTAASCSVLKQPLLHGCEP